MSFAVVVPTNSYSACGIFVIFLVSSLFSHQIEGNFSIVDVYLYHPELFVS